MHFQIVLSRALWPLFNHLFQLFSTTTTKVIRKDPQETRWKGRDEIRYWTETLRGATEQEGDYTGLEILARVQSEPHTGHLSPGSDTRKTVSFPGFEQVGLKEEL